MACWQITERNGYRAAVARVREWDREAIAEGWPSSTHETPTGAEAERSAWIAEFKEARARR